LHAETNLHFRDFRLLKSVLCHSFKMKLLCIIFLSFFTISLGLIPNDKCIEIAKLELCAKFFPEDMATCVRSLQPRYNKVNKRFETIFKVKPYLSKCQLMSLQIKS
jgi:hypothetical protein